MSLVSSVITRINSVISYMQNLTLNAHTLHLLTCRRTCTIKDSQHTFGTVHDQFTNKLFRVNLIVKSSQSSELPMKFEQGFSDQLKKSRQRY